MANKRVVIIKIIGIIFVIAGIWIGFNQIRCGFEIMEEDAFQTDKFEDFKTNANRASGQVLYVEVITNTNYDSGNYDYGAGNTYDTESYFCGIRFEASDGEQYEVKVPVYSSEFHEGDTVEVYYNPDNPTECKVQNPTGGVLKPIAIVFFCVGGIVGGLLVISGFMCLFKKAKDEPSGISNSTEY